MLNLQARGRGGLKLSLGDPPCVLSSSGGRGAEVCVSHAPPQGLLCPLWHHLAPIPKPPTSLLQPSLCPFPGRPTTPQWEAHTCVLTTWLAQAPAIARPFSPLLPQAPSTLEGGLCPDPRWPLLSTSPSPPLALSPLFPGLGLRNFSGTLCSRPQETHSRCLPPHASVSPSGSELLESGAQRVHCLGG